MAYVDNNATAWGEIEFKFGAPGAGGAMGTVLKTLGIYDMPLVAVVMAGTARKDALPDKEKAGVAFLRTALPRISFI